MCHMDTQHCREEQKRRKSRKCYHTASYCVKTLTNPELLNEKFRSMALSTILKKNSLIRFIWANLEWKSL